jgi:hypothetical protein
MTPTEPGHADLAAHVSAMSDEPLVEGDTPLSILMLMKLRDSEGDVVWGVRYAGDSLSSEEQLGALTGFAESIKRDLASDWE